MRLRSIAVTALAIGITAVSATGCSTYTLSSHSGTVTAVAQLRANDSTRVIEVQESGGRATYLCVASKHASCAIVTVGDTITFDAYDVPTPSEEGEYMYGTVTRTPGGAS